MNNLHSVSLGATIGTIGPSRRALLDALPSLASLQDMQVPSGILSRWGEQLDWPRAMLDGTSLNHSRSLPQHIRLRDDLIITANLLDQFGPAAFLETLWTDYAVAADSETMAIISAGPGVAEVTRYFIEAVNLTNPHIRISTVEGRQGGLFQISLVSDIGPVGRFLEHSIAVSLARIAVQLHSPMRQLTIERDALPSLHLRGASQESIQALQKFGRMEVAEGGDKTTLLLPKSIFEFTNKNHDPDLWERAIAELKRHRAKEVSALSIDALRLNVRQSIKLRHRVPNLDEYSRDLSLSKRSLNRRLTDLGVSFRTLVNDERMALAEHYLTSSEEQIEQVAMMLGYSTATSFGRAFKQHFGSSPSEWRATKRSADIRIPGSEGVTQSTS